MGDITLNPIILGFQLVFCAIKPSISFLTSKLLCAIGLKIINFLHPISNEIS